MLGLIPQVAAVAIGYSRITADTYASSEPKVLPPSSLSITREITGFKSWPHQPQLPGDDMRAGGGRGWEKEVRWGLRGVSRVGGVVVKSDAHTRVCTKKFTQISMYAFACVCKA